MQGVSQKAILKAILMRTVPIMTSSNVLPSCSSILIPPWLRQYIVHTGDLVPIAANAVS